MNLGQVAGFEPSLQAALAARMAKWDCPGCGTAMRAGSTPVFRGSVIRYAEDKTCSSHCYRMVAAKHARRVELLRYLGVRPNYADREFREVTAEGKILHQNSDWKSWTADRDVLLYGTNGSGKSFLAVELMVRAWRQGIMAQAMIQLPELMTEHFGDGEGVPLRRKAESVRVAFFDELGRGRAAGAFSAGVITEIIEKRQSYGKTTILATNLDLAGLRNLDSALHDRLTGDGLVIRMGGSSLRQRNDRDTRDAGRSGKPS